MLKHFAEDPENMEPSCNFEKIMSTLFTDSGTPREGNGNQLLMCFCLWVTVVILSIGGVLNTHYCMVPRLACCIRHWGSIFPCHLGWRVSGFWNFYVLVESCPCFIKMTRSGVLWVEKSTALQCPVCLDPLGVLVLRQASNALQQRDTCWCPFRNSSLTLWFSIWIHTGWGSLTALEE